MKNARIWLRSGLGLYSVLVLWVSVMPVRVAAAPSGADKIIHFLMYFVMAILATRVMLAGSLSRRVLVGFGYAVLFGLGMEITQIFLPWRSFEWGDILFNVLGAGLSAVLGKVFYERKIAV